MTAYGAVISLQNTIDQILHSSRFSLVHPSSHIIQLANTQLIPLQQILERLDNSSPSRSRKKVNALDGRIKEKIREFEDLLESLLSQQILSQSTSSGAERDDPLMLFSIDLQPLQDDVPSFIQTLVDLQKEYIYELENMAEDDRDESISSMAGSGARGLKMIGLCDEFQQLKANLMRESPAQHAYALVGAAGVGKTALAKRIFADAQILSHFERRAWVTVGRKPSSIHRLSKDVGTQLSQYGEVERWEDKKCLIVVDDVWEKQIFDSLIHAISDMDIAAVQVLVTSRDESVIANQNGLFINFTQVGVRFLNEEESKDLLCHMMFGDETCPPQLVESATKIAKKCEGLPLLILAVADFLSKSQRRDDPNYWDEVAEKRNMAEDDDEDEPRVGFVGRGLKMIGLLSEFMRVRWYLMHRISGLRVYGFVGMAGVGKTYLAEKLFEDPGVMSCCECRAWVTVGRVPLPITQITRDILAQLCGDEEALEERLEGKKWLIVLDDVWDRQLCDSLIISLPNINGLDIQVLVTSRDRSMSSSVCEDDCTLVPFLNEEESKDLLCHKVFGDETTCPSQLDKAATIIANKCEGLPILILTVAGIISASPHKRDPHYWNDVAERRNSVFVDAYDEISKVLFPSYEYLPQYLKMPFLYMGVFPEDWDTPPSMITNMLTAEGWFLDPKTKQSLQDKVSQPGTFPELSVWECLEELCPNKHLVLFKRKSIFWNENRNIDYGFDKTENSMYGYMLKTCRLHCSWRHVCRGEARKNKFYRVLKKLADSAEEEVKGQRCLSLENNILFGIKGFCNSMRLNCASSTRSLLLFGPYNQYPIPIDVGFRFLRELDALKQRFYTFPTEILTLVQLKYLALTCNGEVPKTISKLFNLQVLIIHPHMNIRCYGAPSYVPIQIWDMQELEHIEILGKSLVAPHHRVASSEKLSKLVGVNASIYTIFELFRKVPRIRKLGVQVELTPHDDHDNLLSCFGCISTLESLETLKCSIINPVVVVKSGTDVVPATLSPLTMPRGLKKLHLSGMNFPWEYMDEVGYLPCLQVLKLRSYAFRGPTWKAKRGTFRTLEFLLIEDSDLMDLNLCGGFWQLRNINIKYCYKLEKINFQAKTFVRKIELVDCNPVAVAFLKQLPKQSIGSLDVTASSTFEKEQMSIDFQRKW